MDTATNNKYNLKLIKFTNKLVVCDVQIMQIY